MITLSRDTTRMPITYIPAYLPVMTIMMIIVISTSSEVTNVKHSSSKCEKQLKTKKKKIKLWAKREDAMNFQFPFMDASSSLLSIKPMLNDPI